MLREDLRNWFSKTHPKGDWVRIGLDGEIKGPCAREEGEGKPKCLNRSRAESMTKAERAKAARRKRRKDPVADRKGKPINVKTESYDPKELEKARKMLTGDQPEPKPGSLSVETYLNMLKGLKVHNDIHKGPVLVKEEYLIEKNVPTNPKLWSQAKALAKKKFDVYPSAYANGWASKWYKKRGGGWKTLKEERQSTMKTTKNLFLEQLDIAQYGHIVEKDDGKDHEYVMARSQLRNIAYSVLKRDPKSGVTTQNFRSISPEFLETVSGILETHGVHPKNHEKAINHSGVTKDIIDEHNKHRRRREIEKRNEEEHIKTVERMKKEETEVQYMVDKEGHKLDGEIIESYEVKSNGRVKVKTASGTGYIKEEDIALYEEEQGNPLGEFRHPETGQRVLGMHHGVTDNGSHKIEIISGDRRGEKLTVPPQDLSKYSHSSLRQSINEINPPSKLPKPSIEALVSMTDPRRD